MTESSALTFDSRFDLVLERTIPVPRERVWDAWTKPKQLKHWFCPKPWTVSEAEIDLRPGGAFNVTMRSPDESISSEPRANDVSESMAPPRMMIPSGVRPPEFHAGNRSDSGSSNTLASGEYPNSRRAATPTSRIRDPARR